MVIVEGWEEKEMETCFFNRCRVSVLQDEELYRWMMMMVVQHYECI